MSYGKLVIRHGFFDFEHVPFAGSNITYKRRAQSAPATLTRLYGEAQRERGDLHVETWITIEPDIIKRLVVKKVLDKS